MAFKIKVHFKNSASTYYETALFNARKFENFQESKTKKELNIVEILSEELQTKITFFNSFWEIIKGWKGTEIYLDDKIIDPKSLSLINNVINCYVAYTKAVVQEKHCKINGDKEGWSCKLLDSIDRYSDGGYYYYNQRNQWYEFGKFTSNTIWEIDKQKIKDLLTRETLLKHLELCPIYNQEKMQSIIENIPGSIDTENSEHWEVKYEENIDGNIVEKKPVGIKPKSVDRERNGLSMRISLRTQEEISKNENMDNRFIPKITYDDIGGIDGILQNIREVIEIPLKNPKLFEHLGITPHKGILLYGPPGCGKTLIAKAIANQVKAHFISIKGPELLSKWHGQSEENLRDVFDEARKLQPAIIFFDELDSVAQRRSSEESLRLDAKFVNQLLTLMDGIEDYGNVRIIATTNRVELNDEALLRPGRFDYHIYVPLPDTKARYEIFKIHLKNKHVSVDIDLDILVKKTDGWTGAHIAEICRRAGMSALRDADFDGTKAMITLPHLQNAVNNIRSSIENLEKDVIGVEVA